MSTTNGQTMEQKVVLTRELEAPQELVYRAWVEPEQMAKWWGPHGFTTPVCELDARPGGKLRIHMQGPDGTIYRSTGVFQEVFRPERLVFSMDVLGDKGEILFQVVTTVTFVAMGMKTTITVEAKASNVTAVAAPMIAGMNEGWSQSLERLAGYVAKG